MQSDYLVYKVRFGQQVVSAAHALIIPSLMLFLLIGNPMIVPCVAVCFILFWIPVLPIHFNYLKEDNGKIIKISYKENVIVIKQYGVKKIIQFEDIQHITINESSPSYKYNPWLNYKYATFKLKDNSCFIITRFTMEFDEELYTLIGTKSKNHWYPIIKEEDKK